MNDINLYFPDDDSWESVEPSSVGWDVEGLEGVARFAEENRSTGLVILHGGRMMSEHYWRLKDISGSRYEMSLKGYDSEGGTVEDVASVQKSFVAVMASIAREKGLFDFDDVASKYLGEGWTKATREQEAQITLKHMLSMSSGLNLDLEYEVPPGEKWFYNTMIVCRFRNPQRVVAQTPYK